MQATDQWTGNIHHGDCLELMRRMPHGVADLIVTSPPYNILSSTGAGLRNNRRGKWGNAALSHGYGDYADMMEPEEYAKWQRACLTAMLDLLPDHGAVYYNHKWRVQDGKLQDRSDIVSGLPVRQIIIWERSGGFNHNPGYHLPTYEVIYLLAKPAFRLNAAGRATPDVWRIDQERDNPHPAPFPVELAARAIRSTDAAVIMDPFLGSGTTAVAAVQEGREYVGIELSAEYCAMAERRIRHHGRMLPEEQLNLF